MNMGLNDKEKKRQISLLSSFSYAIAGIRTAIKQERNIRIHLSISLIVIIFGFLFSITRIEWIFILLTIGGMISLEIINTAIERLVDLVTLEFHPLAKQAKDLAAGAVFSFAIISVMVGIIIFGPYLLRFI
ncbi:MAG: diacylglycerol kinase family protein [Bacillota bacterium]|nr:diacylglycerol kinase family protein [Bacillota bacterium]